MTQDWKARVLTEIETEICNQPQRSVKPLPVDRWLASSVMQKSIRRNDPDTAERAALTYWQADRRSFWRRLHIVGLEDVGAASPDVMVKLLAATHATIWRRSIGDWSVASYLVRLLCGSIKTRLADELYSIVTLGPDYTRLRSVLATASPACLESIIMHEGNPLPERLLSLWYLAGTKRYPADTLAEREGSLDQVTEVLLNLDVPTDLTQACISALNKSPYPLALFTPLLWQEIRNQPGLIMASDPFPPTAMMNGIPLVALDHFTRIGKTAIGTMRNIIPGLNLFTAKQIGLALFYMDGFCVTNRLTSDQLDEYRLAGERADIEAAELNQDRYCQLKGILTRNANKIASIRRGHMRTYQQPAQTGLLI